MKKVFLICYMIFSISLYAKQSPKVDMSNDIIKTVIADQKYVIDKSKIIIKVPDFADNPVQVPIFIDASKIKNVQRLVVFADYNPIPKILDMSVKDFLPIFSANIKVAQETPIRIMVQDEHNTWHIASALIKSAGGGCDVSSQASGNKEFSSLIGTTKGKVFNRKDRQRIKASIFHPMETGLIFGNSEFFVERIIIRNKDKIVSDMEITSVISENPRFTFETNKTFKDLSINFIDNTGDNYLLKL